MGFIGRGLAVAGMTVFMWAAAARAAEAEDGAAALTATAHPRAASFSGRVLELGGPDPVPGAVILDGQGRTLAQADDAGAYAFEVEPGYLELRAAAQGYHGTARRLTATAGSRAELNFWLKRTSFQGREIVVRGRRERHEVSRSELKMEEMRKVPGTGGDMIRAVQALPGVVTASDYNGELAVRGGGPRDNKYYLDGVPWPVPFHPVGSLSTVNKDLLDSVALYPAGFPSRFGDADGAILEATTRPGRKDRLHAELDMSMLMGGGMVEGPTGALDGSWTLAGRRSYFELIEPYLRSAGLTAIPTFWDAGMTMELNPDAKNRIRLVALGNEDVVEADVTKDDVSDPDYVGRYRFRDQATSVGLNWTSRSLEGVTFSLVPYWDQVLEEQSLGAPLEVDLRPQDFGFKGQAALDELRALGMGHALMAGGQVDRMEYEAKLRFQRAAAGTADWTVPVLERVEMSEHGVMNTGAVWAEDRIGLLPDLHVTAGARYEMNEWVAQGLVCPRMGVEWNWDERTLWKASWGVYGQAPEATQLHPVLGNPNLGYNRTQHTVLSLEKKLAPGFTGKAEAYDKEYADRVVAVDDARRWANEGEGHARGVELTLRQELTSRFFGWVSYAYTLSERKDGVDKAWESYEYDQPHVLNVVASYDITPQWNTGVKVRWNSGSLVRPLKDRGQDARGVWYASFDDTRWERLDDYFRVDWRTEYNWLMPNLRVKLYLDVMNVFNRKNPAGVMYNKDYSERKVVYNFPLMPNVGVQAEF